MSRRHFRCLMWVQRVELQAGHAAVRPPAPLPENEPRREVQPCGKAGRPPDPDGEAREGQYGPKMLLGSLMRDSSHKRRLRQERLG